MPRTEITRPDDGRRNLRYARDTADEEWVNLPHAFPPFTTVRLPDSGLPDGLNDALLCA